MVCYLLHKKSILDLLPKKLMVESKKAQDSTEQNEKNNKAIFYQPKIIILAWR